jgi:dienelactone hydrolase
MAPMPKRRKRWGRRVALVALLAMAAGVWIAWPYVSSAALLMDMTGVAPDVRRWLPVREHDVETRDLVVPTRHGEMPARVYRAAGLTSPTIAIFPGVHGGGLDEPRLHALSRRIAAAGAVVISAPLPDLRRYTLTPRSTDMIEDTIGWVGGNPGLTAAGERIGVVGVSFAGGLALVAAGRPGVSERISGVFALGAHADLPRVVQYLCLADGAPKTLAPPHDYGVVLMLRASVPLVVPAGQVAPLDRAIVTFLDASSAENDLPRAARLFEEARVLERGLPEPARGLMRAVNDRDVATLGTLLAPHAEQIAGAAGLSPARSPLTSAPVFLLHGVDDNVIPAHESEELARILRESGNTKVELLLTPLLSHAQARPDASRGDVWRLIRFWTDMWGRFD